jgi:hypothetical protein
MRILTVSFIVGTLLLGACSSSDPTVQPTVVIQVAPTPVPSPTATMVPVSTPTAGTVPTVTEVNVPLVVTPSVPKGTIVPPASTVFMPKVVPSVTEVNVPLVVTPLFLRAQRAQLFLQPLR